MRVFLAVEIPESIKKKLVGVQEELRPLLPGVRWESPKKLHITLVFLGEVDGERLGELEEAVRKGIKGVKGLKVGLSEVSVFPKGKRPRVVLLEIGEGREEIERLQKRLAEALAGAGFDFAKLSRLHVTLGRFKRKPQELSTLRVDRLFKQRGCHLATLRVAEVVMVESELHPKGAIHTPLARVNLAL